MRFTDAGPEYQPAGTPHAVDAESEMFIPRAVVDCAVRVWPDRWFDPDGGNAHDRALRSRSVPTP
jgi:hypothetical protein